MLSRGTTLDKILANSSEKIVGLENAFHASNRRLNIDILYHIQCNNTRTPSEAGPADEDFEDLDLDEFIILVCKLHHHSSCSYSLEHIFKQLLLLNIIDENNDAFQDLFDKLIECKLIENINAPFNSSNKTINSTLLGFACCYGNFNVAGMLLNIDANPCTAGVAYSVYRKTTTPKKNPLSLSNALQCSLLGMIKLKPEGLKLTAYRKTLRLLLKSKYFDDLVIHKNGKQDTAADIHKKHETALAEITDIFDEFEVERNSVVVNHGCTGCVIL